MTHDTQGKRWPPTAGVEADFITVETSGGGSIAAERLRLHGIPHTTINARDWFGGSYAAVVLGAKAPTKVTPPVLEGWSFSVYNGAEEYASGWGSASLADMAPALLAAVGMTDAATAHKRAHVAETRAISLAGERDAAVEALDTANDMIGKLKRELSTAQSERDTAKRELATAQMQLRDISRVLGPRRTERDITSATVIEESVVSQADRTRKILDRWQDLACKFLPACPQLSHALCGADLGTRHFELRGYMEGEINALRSRLSLAAEREDQTIAALGHPCSTNGIPAAVKEIVQREAKMREVFEARNHVTTELGAWRELGAALTGLDAHKATNDELREAVDTKICGDSHEIARLRDSLNARATGDALALTKPLRVALGWAERRDLSAERVVEAAVVAVTHSVAMSKEVTRLNAALENTGGYGARERVKTLTAEVHRLTVQSLDQLSSLTDARKEAEGWKAAHTKTFAQLQEAYDAMNNGHEALTADAKEALDYLIAHPGRGLTSELACEGAKRLRRHIEHGIPATQPLRSLLDLALSSGVNAAHEMWDGEVQRTRDEGVQMRWRLDQWVAWGCRAACLNAAPDEALRGEIDKALPMWRRGAPAV